MTLPWGLSWFDVIIGLVIVVGVIYLAVAH